MSRFALAAGVAVWACLVVLGLKWIADYKTTPGAQGPAPVHWPRASALSPPAGTATLVMFVHPKCPCTDASLSELEVVMNEDRSSARAFVVFLRPSGTRKDWEQTAAWTSAGRIPRATRVVDLDGAEASLFGARTSGHLVVYDAAGELTFAGGITDSRGHQGDNVGRRTVMALLDGGSTKEHGHAVYGCELQPREAVVAAGSP